MEFVYVHIIMSYDKRIPGWSFLYKGNKILPFIIADMKSHLMRIPK